MCETDKIEFWCEFNDNFIQQRHLKFDRIDDIKKTH